MDVSWLTCRPNDRQKMPSLLPEPPAAAVFEIAALSGHDADIPKSTQMTESRHVRARQDASSFPARSYSSVSSECWHSRAEAAARGRSQTMLYRGLIREYLTGERHTARLSHGDER